MLAHFKNLKERKNCYKHLENVELGPGVTVYAFLFGPNVNSPIDAIKITAEGQESLGTLPYQKPSSDSMYEKYLNTLRYLVRSLHRNGVTIHGINYYGHSSGLEMGSFFSKSRVLATTLHFVDVVLKPLQPKVLIFDSCYMGLISALYEISRVKSILYVMASPSYHPSFSILETKAFGKIGVYGRDKASIAYYLHKASCEFQNITWPAYRCFLVFNIRKIPKFVEKDLRNAIRNEQLIFDDDTVVVKEDSMYDLYRSARDPELRKKIKQIGYHGCGASKCKIIRGMSIDIDLPELHVPIYQKMKWYNVMKDVIKFDIHRNLRKKKKKKTH